MRSFNQLVFTDPEYKCWYKSRKGVDSDLYYKTARQLFLTGPFKQHVKEELLTEVS